MTKHALIAAAGAALIALTAQPMSAVPALAMGQNDPPPAAKTMAKSDYTEGVKAVRAGDYARGISILKKVVAEKPTNADAHNYLGFAYRSSGELRMAADSYIRALTLNPNHQGALEYQGELFLRQDNLSAAEGNLARLVALCPGGCQERDELEQAISKFRAGVKPGS